MRHPVPFDCFGLAKQMFETIYPGQRFSEQSGEVVERWKSELDRLLQWAHGIGVENERQAQEQT